VRVLRREVATISLCSTLFRLSKEAPPQSSTLSVRSRKAVRKHLPAHSVGYVGSQIEGFDCIDLEAVCRLPQWRWLPVAAAGWGDRRRPPVRRFAQDHGGRAVTFATGVRKLDAMRPYLQAAEQADRRRGGDRGAAEFRF
jgi:hypothetical protein